MEKSLNHRTQSIRISTMARWSIIRLNMDAVALINSEQELGLGVTKTIRRIPIGFQLFCLYSWQRRECKWGVGLYVQI